MTPMDCIARTIWGEARGCGTEGMEAVACVIMNRARNPRWWGGPDPVSVCLKPFQFSCWLPDDPNREKLLAVTEADPQFREAMDIAHRAVLGLLADITENADSYFAIGSPEPDWAMTATRTVTIGGQMFFRTELPAPRAPVRAPFPD